MQITKKNEKKRNDLHTPVPVSPLNLSSLHSGKYHGESFFCDYLNVWILWLCAFIWSPAQWKPAWTDARKLTEHFGTKYGWIEDDCGKNCHQKLGPLGCPFRLVVQFCNAPQECNQTECRMWFIALLYCHQTVCLSIHSVYWKSLMVHTSLILLLSLRLHWPLISANYPW